MNEWKEKKLRNGECEASAVTQTLSVEQDNINRNTTAERSFQTFQRFMCERSSSEDEKCGTERSERI